MVPPFETLSAKVTRPHSGAQLAAALREFWQTLDVERKLEEWGAGEASTRESGILDSVHATIWDQMQNWLENLESAFPTEALPLRDWLPILEAGLANLTVGVIPPMLDQVLIGTVDRSRNPDLQLVLLLGIN